MKRVIAILVLLCFSISIRAQTTPSVVTMQNAATATGNGTAIVVGVSAANPGANLGAVGVQIVGTFSATITFEATTDGTNWTPVMATNLEDDVRATTATAAGQYTILYGSAIRIRARISSYSSGSVTVKGRLIPGLTARLTSGGGGGGGSGDVVGPASATDNAVARFNLTTGKLIQNSVVTIGDTGDTAGVANLTFTGVLTGGSAPTTITDSAGKILSAALNTVQPAQGGTGITALGTGIATALGVNIGSAGAPVLFDGAGGTPSGIVLTNATGLPPTTGISGWPANSAGVLTNNGSGTLSWAAAGGSPGGSSGQFQFNNAGAFGGTTGVSYASSGSPTVSITGQSTSQLSTLITGPNTSSTALLGIQLGTGGSSGDFVQFRNSSGTALSVIDSTGAAGFGITSSLGAKLHAVAGSSGNAGRFDGAALSTNTVLVARQGSSSIGNLFEAQTSGGTAFFTIANGGQLIASLPVTTGTGATAGFQITANSLTTGNGVEVSSTSATSGSLVSIASTSTAATSNTLTGLNISMSGANASSAQLVSGATISVTNTNATSGTNAALTLSASGATGALTTGPNRALNITAGQSVFPDGTNLLPSLTFATNKGTGIYLAGSSIIGFTANVSQAMVLNSFDLVVQNNGSLGITGGTGTTADVIWDRVGAGHWRSGSATDAASPIAQTLSVQNVVAGTSDTAGANWTLRGSLGTSQGVPGRVHLTGGAMIAASGTTQQTAVDRVISGATKVLTNNSATTIVNVTNATETSAGGVLDYCIEVTDGTDTQYECGMATYGISNKGGVFSGNTVTKFGNHQNATSGTLTVTFAISGANPGALSVNANSSLTPSTGYPRVVYSLRNLGNQAVSVQ